MKKWYLFPLLTLCFLFNVTGSSAQCSWYGKAENGNLYTPIVGNQTVGIGNSAYVNMKVYPGGIYHFDFCGDATDNELTGYNSGGVSVNTSNGNVFFNDDNNNTCTNCTAVACAQTLAPDLNWTSTFSGTLYVQRTLYIGGSCKSWSCGTNTITGGNGCGSTSSYGSSTLNYSCSPATGIAQGTAGNGTWNVFCYNAGDASGTSGSWSTNYSGYYTESNLSFDTRNRWSSLPSDASGYQGCYVAATSHSWRAIRTNIAQGTYQLQMDHDDIGQILINGNTVYNSAPCCSTRSAGNFAIVTGDVVEFRVAQGTGGAYGTIAFNTAAALNAGSISYTGPNPACPSIAVPTIGSSADASGGATASINSYGTTAGGGTTTYQWYLNGSPISGANASTYTPGTLSTGTYVYTRQVTDRFGATATTSGVTITVTSPLTLADGTTGTNQWNMFTYNSQTIGTNYSGYNVINQLNFDTRLGQGNSGTWSFNQASQGPSSSTGYTGCFAGADNISYRFIRTGFPCGNYTISMVNDDNATLYVNGTAVTLPTPSGGSPGSCCFSAYTTAWTGYLGPNSKVEYQIVEGGGDTYAGLAFVNNSALAVTSGTGPVCPGSTLTLTDNHSLGTGDGTPVWSITSNTSPTSSVSGTTFTAGTVTGSNQTATVQVSEEGCTATQSVTVTGLGTIAQGTAGNGTWNTFFYNAGDANGGSGSWVNNYTGYYTENTLSFDTRNRWANGGVPSTANTSTGAAYIGCATNSAPNSWRAIRTNIPCGTYQIQLDFDDAAYLLINGTSVYSFTTSCCVSRSAGTFVIQPSDIVEYRVSNGGGGSYAQITFNTATALNAGTIAYAGSTTACTGYSVPTITSSADASGGALASVNGNSTSAGGGTTTYQWLLNGSPISGANASTYTPGVLSSAGTYVYTRKVTDKCSNTATTNGVTITINAQPTITITGGDVTVCTGAAVTLTGTPSNGAGTPSYQWQSSTTSGGTYTNVATAGTSATYSPVTTAAGTLYYRVLISYNGSSCSTNVPSTNTTFVTVNAQPTITVSGGNVTVCNGASVTLTGTPSGGTGTASYQWQSSTTTGGTYTNVASGGTSATYTPVTTTNGTLWYRVLVSYSGSGCGSNVVSTNNQSITVNAQPTIAVTGGDVTVCNGATVTLTGTPSGGTGTASYQWQSATTSGGTYTNVATGGTSATYNPVTTTNGTLYYRVLISYNGTNCSTNVPSTNSMFVAVNAQPAITVSGGDVTVCNGASVTLTGTPSGGAGTASYQWQSSTTSGGTYTNVATAGTSATYSPVTTANGTLYYRVLISYNGSSCSTNVPSTNNMFVAVNAQPTITVSGGNVTVCNGASVTLTGTPSGGAGTASYQWQSSTTSGGTYTNVASGGTSATYNPVTTTNGTLFYRVLISYSGSNCSSNVASTNNQSVTVNAQPTITVTGGDVSVCNGANLTLTGTPSGGTGTASYQWQSATTSGGTYTNVATGGTSATYNPVTSTNGTLYYRVLISYNGSNCSTNVPSTNSMFVTVNAQPTISVSGGNVTVCNGASVTLTGTPAGGSGTASYQWQSATTSGGTYSNVATGGTSATYSPVTTANGTLYYRVLISYNGSNCSTNVPSTNNMFVTVVAQPSIVVTGGNVAICNGASVTLTGTPSNGTGTATYQWQSATTSGGTYTNVASGGTSSTYSPSTATNGTLFYQVLVSYSGNGCNSNVPSNNQSVNVNAYPTAVTVSGGGTYCAAATLTASGGTGGTIYYQGTTSGGTSTATASSSQVVSSAGTYYFRAVSGAGNCWSTEGSATVAINPGPFTTSTWTGTVDGDWFNHNNWTQCVPGVNTVVTIPVVGSGNYPNTFGSNPTASSITINTGASMTLNAGRVFTVASDVTVNGTLTMSGSSKITMPGNFSSIGALNGGNGTIEFTGSSTSTLTTNTSGSTFNNINVNKSGGAKVTMANNITSTGTLTVTNGVFEVPTSKNISVGKVNNSSSGSINVKAGGRIDLP